MKRLSILREPLTLRGLRGNPKSPLWPWEVSYQQFRRVRWTKTPGGIYGLAPISWTSFFTTGACARVLPLKTQLLSTWISQCQHHVEINVHNPSQPSSTGIRSCTQPAMSLSLQRDCRPSDPLGYALAAVRHRGALRLAGSGLVNGNLAGQRAGVCSIHDGCDATQAAAGTDISFRPRHTIREPGIS
jgi:hypothetical protein